MKSHRHHRGTLVISKKWTLRLGGLLLLGLGVLLFFFSTLNFRLVGGVIAAGVVCLILGEFSED